MIKINAIETKAFPKVNMLMTGASKKNPITIPVHLAHKGNCTPLKKNDLSLS